MIQRLFLPMDFYGSKRPYRAVVVMYAHIDDGGQGKFFILASYLENDPRFECLHNQWGELLGKYELPGLKVADFMTGQPEYSKIIKTQEERLAALDEFCVLVDRYPRYGFVASADQDAFVAALGERKGTKNPLAFLFYRVIARLYARMASLEVNEPIQFILDDSERDAPRFYSVWSKAKKFKSFARGRLSSITFSDDRMDFLIQTADLLANAIANEHPGGTRHAQGGPFKSLFNSGHVKWEHWDAEMFAKNPDVIADYGMID